ncbi:S8 family peptidase [Bacillus cereus]|uniref:S8 family peptidase n=1 Tax=Bacillus cereus TaxID=1396 RepID=UPI001076B533|nr:S8 family serine peptidase [Bacillus cereus]TFZ11489.1 peptidase S8 [Bacillus cereus]
MKALDLVRLKELMNITTGKSEIRIGLIDGPVATKHPDLIEANIRRITGKTSVSCINNSSFACMHGTFLAGILSAKRESMAPAICPKCTLLVRPIFSEIVPLQGPVPVATPAELAKAIIECIEAGARVINLSLAVTHPSSREEQILQEALDYAAIRGTIVVAASGNQGTIGSTVITRHTGVIPVVACNIHGLPVNQSNLGITIGRKGLCAPGEDITSLSSQGQSIRYGGTSVATPFVTGTIALLWSKFPHASATEIRLALKNSFNSNRRSIIPRLLDAWEAYNSLAIKYHK